MRAQYFLDTLHGFFCTTSVVAGMRVNTMCARSWAENPKCCSRSCERSRPWDWCEKSRPRAGETARQEFQTFSDGPDPASKFASSPGDPLILCATTSHGLNNQQLRLRLVHEGGDHWSWASFVGCTTTVDVISSLDLTWTERCLWGTCHNRAALPLVELCDKRDQFRFQNQRS